MILVYCLSVSIRINLFEVQLSAMDQKAEVLLKYQQKNFSSCLSLIDESPIEVQNSMHFKVVKAACIVNLGTNIEDALQILDEVLIIEKHNAFAFYCKGLAFFTQEKLTKAINCFNKAIENDSSGSMEKAREMKEMAEKMINECADKGQTKSKDDINDDVSSENERKTSERKVIKIKMARKPATVDKAKNKEETKKSENKISIDPVKKCKICSKSFTKTFSLTRHMQLHTLSRCERPHKCEFCSFAFIQKSDLNRHKAIHGDAFDFECQDCDRKFKTKKNLQCHRMTHVNDRPFQCSVCPKAFKLPKLLKFHENIHNNLKPFGCDLCGKLFTTKPYMVSHIRTHLNDKPFGCNLCRITYQTIARLGLHFREYHGVGKGSV